MFRALHDVRLYIYGVKSLVVEVDAKYIKGMLNNPDMQPNAVINRWIAGILLHNPRLVHVPATKHTGADGLSRRRPSPDDPEQEDDSEPIVHSDTLYHRVVTTLELGVAVQDDHQRMTNHTES